MTKTVTSAPSGTAFFFQAAISFGIALVATTVGIVYLPVDPWIRAFLVVGALYLVTSALARLDKLFAEHDPFKTPAV
jgi:hypothetical protein